MNEDDSSSERCPMCDKKECQKHLLVRFDASGDEGEYGVGLMNGALYGEYEIEEVLNRARLAWVQSVRATGKPKVPRWIMNERGLKDYFNHLGPIDVSNYESDEEAAEAPGRVNGTEGSERIGPIHWDVDNCPVAMELNEPAGVKELVKLCG